MSEYVIADAAKDRSATVSLDWAKRRLAKLWFIGTGLIFFLFILQTVFGRFGPYSSEAFGWLLPTIMPTLSLIASVLVWDSFGSKTQRKKVDRFLFGMTFWLSFLYLLAVVFTIMLQPFTTTPIIKVMSQSNLYLGPFQGLVVACLGAFFVNSENLSQQDREEELERVGVQEESPLPRQAQEPGQAEEEAL